MDCKIDLRWLQQFYKSWASLTSQLVSAKFCPLVIRFWPYLTFTRYNVAPLPTVSRIFFTLHLPKKTHLFATVFWHPTDIKRCFFCWPEKETEVDEYRRVCLERCAVGMLRMPEFRGRNLKILQVSPQKRGSLGMNGGYWLDDDLLVGKYRPKLCHSQIWYFNLDPWPYRTCG